MKKGNYKGLLFTLTNKLKTIPNKVFKKVYNLNIGLG
jgi:hypothetical protein